MHYRNAYATLVAGITLLLLATSSFAYAGSSVVVPEASAVHKPGLFVEPRFAAPAFVEPGTTFRIVLSENVNVSSIFIDDGYGHHYELEYSGSNGVYEVKIPGDAAFGVYDLFIAVNGQVYGEPHAVVVSSPDRYRELLIVHITDRHFGVINTNGRPASNYDLAAVLIALSLPDNTIVIDTGDVADTAKVNEYRESLLVDYLLDKPFIGIPGNHDHVGGFTNYEKYRGPWNYTLSIYGLYRVVGIDSGGDGYIDVSQAKWAAAVLESSKEPVKIVLFHHPHFTHLFGDVPYNFTADSWEKLLEILLSQKPGSNYTYIYGSWLENKEALNILVKAMYEAEYRRMLVLSGHVHLNSYAEVHKPDGSTINYIVTTATGGSVRSGDYHGYRVVKVTSTGSFEAYGEGPVQVRHASFTLEPVEVRYVVGPAAATMILRFTNTTRILDLLNRTVVALPVPEKFAGANVSVSLEGLEEYRLRCTPLACTVYGFAPEKPVVGETYRVTLYTKEDTEPPKLRFERMAPRKPLAGRQVVLRFRVSDDAWGIAFVEAYVSFNGRNLTLKPTIMGNTMQVIIPPLRGVDKAKVYIRLVDASGKETVWSKVIEYQKPETLTPVATTKTTTRTQTETVATTTTTVQTTTKTTAPAPAPAETAKPVETTTRTTTKAATSPQQPATSPATPVTTSQANETSGAAQAAAEQAPKTRTRGGRLGDVVIVGGLIVAAVAFLAFMARRGG